VPGLLGLDNTIATASINNGMVFKVEQDATVMDGMDFSAPQARQTDKPATDKPANPI